MNVNDMKIKMSVDGKNGISFLLSGLGVWAAITLIFVLPLDLYYKNILMLLSTGLMFPLSIAISKGLKADWKFLNNPLGDLGVYFNVGQFLYFPIIFWAFAHNPSMMVIFFAVITGAHFFPYGWLYDSKPFYVLSPIMSIIPIVIGWNINEGALWYVPLTFAILLALLIFLLIKDYKKKELLLQKEPSI
ncbi:DUF7010 family protein [Bacillus sp. FJAT-44742]|uniref:DUF7010 family protein n=1 Tax=Bacillus sp. FJAT-44742 TaxID=2014005 RepID=UPI000C23DB9B|nr:hypothetical protein [Bacillus sp. FJAT-44742]